MKDKLLGKRIRFYDTSNSILEVEADCIGIATNDWLAGYKEKPLTTEHWETAIYCPDPKARGALQKWVPNFNEYKYAWFYMNAHPVIILGDAYTSISSLAPKEIICPNSGCLKRNNLGAMKCWWCEGAL